MLGVLTMFAARLGPFYPANHSLASSSRRVERMSRSGCFTRTRRRNVHNTNTQKLVEFLCRFSMGVLKATVSLNTRLRRFWICVFVSPCPPCGSEPFSIGVAHMTTAFRWTWSRTRIGSKHNTTPAGTCKFSLFFSFRFCSVSGLRGRKAPNVPQTSSKHRAYTT